MIALLLITLNFSHAQTSTPPSNERRPGDEQYRKDIIQYTREECAHYSDNQLEKSRKVWLRKFSKNNCKRKQAIKPAEIKELCDELNVHLDIIQAEQFKRKKTKN